MYLPVPLSKVLQRVHRSRGLDPNTYVMNDKEAQGYSDLINNALQDVWQSEFWPEICLIEQRTFAPFWDASSNYPAGNIVYRDNGVYGIGGVVITQPTFAFYCMSVQQNTNQDPITDTTNTYWITNFEWVKCIPFDLTWVNPDGNMGTPIDNIFLPKCAMYKNPLYGDDRSWVTGLDIWERSIRFPRIGHRNNLIGVNSVGQPLNFNVSNYNKPFIKFRPICPEISAVSWSDTTPYAIGDRVYFVTMATNVGHCYVCIQPSTNNQPDSSMDYWAPIDLPQIFFNYICIRARAELIAQDEGKPVNMMDSDTELQRLRDRYIVNTGSDTQVVFDNSSSWGEGSNGRW